MKNINFYIVLFSLLISVIITACINPSAGVETTNGATVVMKDNRVDGTSPPFASIYIFDTSYIPYVDTGFGIATTSGEDGSFSIHQISANVINVQVVDIQKRYTVLISAGDDGKTYRSELKPPGTLVGSVETAGAGKVLVFIGGTGYYVLLNGSGEWNFKELPPATYKVQAVLLRTTTGDKPVIVSSSEKMSVNVVSGEMTRMTDNLVIK